MEVFGVFASISGQVKGGLWPVAWRLLISLCCAVGLVACGGGQSTSSTTVAMPVISAFSATALEVAPGGATQLKWSTSNATQVTLDQVAVSHQEMEVKPIATTTYVLTASNSAGSVSSSVTVKVVPLPVIDKFSVFPLEVVPGELASLNWSTSQATDVTLDAVAVATSTGTNQGLPVRPSTTTTYLLTARNSVGSVTATVTVLVGPPRGLVATPAVQVAREAVVSDQQSIVAPPIGIKFVRASDNRGASNTFQVQFILSEGAWVLSANPERALRLEDLATGVVADQGSIRPPYRSFFYLVQHVGISFDKRTLFFTIAGQQTAFEEAALQKPLVSLNPRSNTINGVAGVDVSANAVRIAGLKELTRYGDLGADSCSAAKKLKVSFKTFVALSWGEGLADVANGTADEHMFPSSLLSIDLMDFVSNIKLAVEAPALSVRTGNNRFGFAASTPSNASFIDANTALLGKLNLTQNAEGLDIGMQAPYLLAGNADSAGLVPQTVASLSNGRVEASAFTARLTATNGLAVGSSVFLSGAANCAAAITGTEQLVNNSNAKGPLDLTIPTTGLVSSFGSDAARPVYVCYRVPANTVVPATDIATTVTLSKATGDLLGEQANTCAGRLTSVE